MIFDVALYHVNPRAPRGSRLAVYNTDKILERGAAILTGEKPLLALRAADEASGEPTPLTTTAAYVASMVEEIGKKWSTQKWRAYAATCGCAEAATIYDAVRHCIFFNHLGGLHAVYGASLYKKLVYFNHSCRPNAFLYFDAHHNAYVTALRRIEPHEEITIAYAPFLRDDCAAIHGSKGLLGFECWCEMCEKNMRKCAPAESTIHFEMPAFDLHRFYNNQKADYVGVEMVRRVVPQLMQTLADPTQAAKNYQLASLLLKQERAWRAFTAAASGPLLVHLGLHVSRCALMATAKKFEEANSKTKLLEELFYFFQHWLVVLSARSGGNDAPAAVRYGILLHTLFTKFFRALLFHRVDDFVGVFRNLMRHMKHEAFPQCAEHCFSILQFHVGLLGWKHIFKIFEE